MTEKELLRKEYLNKTASLTVAEKKEASLIIADKLLNCDIIRNSKNINVYLSFKNEVDTSFLIKKLTDCKKNLSAPVLNGETLKAVCLNENTGFTFNRYNIKEPQGKVQQDIDVVIVPLVAFDGSLTRLGRGKGYYDRFLKETNAFKLGIAFSSQQAERLPCSKLDVKLDAVITEKDIFTANGKNYI